MKQNNKVHPKVELLNMEDAVEKNYSKVNERSMSALDLEGGEDGEEKPEELVEEAEEAEDATTGEEELDPMAKIAAFL